MKLPRIIKNGPTSGAVLPFIAPGKIIIGLDEVGRGAWAGPLLMAAVILRGPVPEGVTDSKLLSAKRRGLLSRHIKFAAAGIGFGWVSAAEIDQIGLATALRVAARRAIAAVNCRYDVVIIDGSINLLPEHGALTLPKADLHVPAVAAASIVAKVARDNYMRRLARADTRYGFDQHVGYGTALHIRMLQQHGPSLHHRHSFRPIQEAGHVDR